MQTLKNAVGGLVKIISKLSFATYLLAGFLVVFMSVMISVSCVTRYGFNAPIATAVDITGFMLFYLTFLAAPWILKNDAHVNVDIVREYLSKKTVALFDIINNLFIIFCSVLMTIFGVYLTYDQFVRMELLYGAIEMPKFLLTFVIPISGILLLIVASVKLAEAISLFRTGKNLAGEEG